MTTRHQICTVDLCDQGPPCGGSSIPFNPPQPWPAGGALIEEAEGAVGGSPDRPAPGPVAQAVVGDSPGELLDLDGLLVRPAVPAHPEAWRFDCRGALEAIYGCLPRPPALLLGEGIPGVVLGSTAKPVHVPPDTGNRDGLVVWAGGIWDAENRRPVVGAYYEPGLHCHDLVSYQVATHGGRVGDWARGLGRGTIAYHTEAFAEADEGTLAEQMAAIDAFEAATGLTFGLLVHSGATAPEIVDAADVNVDWVRPGKSIHSHLLLAAPCKVAKDTEEQKWLRLQRLLCVALRGDPAIADVSRRMRLPGVVAPAPGRSRWEGVRLQALARPIQSVRYGIDDAVTRIGAHLATEGVSDPDASFRALRLAAQLAKAATKIDDEGDTQKAADTRRLAAKIRQLRAADEADERAASVLLGRPDSGATAGIIDPETVVHMADGRQGTLKVLTADMEPGEATQSCYCPVPEHANTRTPAATIGRSAGGRSFVHCFGGCGHLWVQESALADGVFTFGSGAAQVDDLRGWEPQGGTTPPEKTELGSATGMSAAPCATETSGLDSVDLSATQPLDGAGGTTPPKRIELGSATGTASDPCATGISFTGGTTPHKEIEQASATSAEKPQGAGVSSAQGAGGTTPTKKIERGSATRLVRVKAKRLTDAIPDALGLLPPEGGILLIRSPQETGKTYLAAQVAAECLRRFPDDGQVAPTHRVALVRDLAGRLGYATYDVDASAQRVASTMDSLWRVPTFVLPDEVGTPTDRKFSLVVLDEGSQVLRHLVGGTVGADAPRVISHLKIMLANARYVLVMDADLDDGTVEKYGLLAPGKAVVCVDNEWRPTDRAARIYSDRNDHVAALVADVGAGNRVAYLTAGGPKRAAAVASMAQQARPGALVRIYSQDTSRLPEVQDELADINTAISKYAVIIATPTLGSGVDIQDTGIERVYLDIPSHEVGADEAVQLGFRVRQPKDREWRIWVDPRKQNREVDPERIREEILSVAKQTSGAVAKKYANAPCVRWVTATAMSPVDDLHLDLYCWARAHVHRQTNDLAGALRARLTEGGFKITEQGVVDPVVAQQAKQDFTAAREATEDTRAARISAATQVNEEEAERIRRARRATQEEQDSGVKAEIGSFYGAPVTPELVREDDRGNIRGKLHLLAVHLLARQGEGHAALQPDVKRLRQGLTARVRGQYIAALILPHLLALYGVPTGTAIETFVGTLAPVPTFQQDVKRLAPVIRRFLRVSHRPLTVTRNGKTIWLAGVDPIHLLSRVLAAFGLGLICTKAKVAGKTTRAYAIDTALATHRLALAQATCQRLRDNLAELNRLATADSPAEAIMLTDEDILGSLGHLVPDGGGTTIDDLLRGGSATFDVEAADEPAAEAMPLAVAPASAASPPRPWAVNDEDERRDDRRSRWWGADGPSAWA